MPEWTVYLLKANMSLILFYLGYFLFLRKLTFYTINRFYLLFGLLFSMLCPLVDLDSFFQKQIPRETVLVNWQQLTIPERSFTQWDLVAYMGCLIACVFLFRFLLSLGTLWKIHRHSQPSTFSIYHYRKILYHINPFSFWKTIYMNPSLHQEAELNKIFQHEYVHIDELHTIDVLLVELICIGCWFNPAVWFTKRAIQENLEFIADRKVLKNGMDKKSYQYSLVHLIAQQNQVAIGSHFNFKSIKKRIMMMNRKRSSRLQISKYFLMVPVIVLLAVIFTVSNAYEEKRNPSLIKPQAFVVDTMQKKFLPKKKVNPQKAKPLVSSSDQNPLPSQGANPIPRPKAKDPFEPITVVGYSAEEANKRKNPTKDQEEVTLQISSQADTAHVGPKRIKLIGYSAKEVEDKDKQIPMYLLDGEIISREQMNDLVSPDRIEAINVYKGKDGERSRIEITTKK